MKKYNKKNYSTRWRGVNGKDYCRADITQRVYEIKEGGELEEVKQHPLAWNSKND